MFKKVGWPHILIGLGTILCVSGGVWAVRQPIDSDVVVEVEQKPSPSTLVSEDVVIDIQGAVQQPGVYKMKAGARIVELIKMAGGVTKKADLKWMAKSLNQAEVLRDGVKLYIPLIGEEMASGGIQTTSFGNSSVNSALNQGDGVVHVNAASEAELDLLWGIGAARAKTIVENRPYASFEELSEKAKIPKDVLDKNEGKIAL